MKYARYNQGLAALTTMVIVMVILIILIASYGLITASAARQFSNVYQSARAYYVAEAGVEVGIAKLSDPNFQLEAFTIDDLVSGKVTVEFTQATSPVPSTPATEATYKLTSTGDAGSRKRAIEVRLQRNAIYTYAALVGDGGLWMSDATDIKCVSGSGCKGETEAGDAGTVWVNGPIWANGSDAGGKLGLSVNDARVAGHVYTTGKVDIRPSEKKEPSLATGEHKFVCLGVGITNSGCAIQATAIAQKVRIHEGGKRTKRFAFRVAYHGSPDALPEVSAYAVRKDGSFWKAPQRMALDRGDDKLFANFMIDTNHDGSGEAYPADVATSSVEWLYFNIPGTTGLDAVNDDDDIYIVLQAENETSSGNNYYKIYYDESDELGYIHTGGSGRHTLDTFCLTSAVPVTCNSVTGGTALDGLLIEDSRVDFHFRVYSQGDDDDNYENSLQVFGELHADEAIGASVIGEGVSGKDIAFVGRRFVSAFWKDRHAHARLWGHSFVQQLDNCDLGGAGTETVGVDIESRRGWRPFCDSQVRNVKDAIYGGVSERRYSVNASLYPVDTNIATRFYCNPYKNANNVTHGGTATSCTQDSLFNTNTPYEFNTMAQVNGRGCYFGCGNGENTSCGSQDIYKTHYIYPYNSQYPYNFCKYAGGTADVAHTDETAFKTMLTALAPVGYGIAEIDTNDYLPKAPPTKSPWPISELKISGWASSLFPPSCLSGGQTISTSVSWSSSTCIGGDLTIDPGGKLTLNKGAHVHVQGNLYLKDSSTKLGGRIEMNGSSGALGWDPNSVGLVIVDGFIDMDADTQLAGGNKADDEYLFVISKSTNMGEYDANDDRAAIYALSRQEGGATVSYYAQEGSVVLGRNANAMQVAARKLVMRRGTQITYDYGTLDMKFPDGPTSAFGVSDYDEIAP